MLIPRRRPLLVALALAGLSLSVPLLAADTTAPVAAPRPVAANPLLEAWNTPFGTPPFDRIEETHYQPALEEAMRRHKAEIAAIAGQKAEPTFANTIDALERSGPLLRKVASTFFNVYQANSTPVMEELGTEMVPKLQAHQSELYLNLPLFERVAAIHAQRAELGLTTEQLEVLDVYYTGFVRGGAQLKGADRKRFKANSEELSRLSVAFGQNLLKETNEYALFVSDREQLAGLPAEAIEAAAREAETRGKKGQWAFTLQKPSLLPFLTFAEHRGHRETLWKAYVNRGNNGNANDNNALIPKILALRAENARLLGFASPAAYAVAENMAKTPEAIEALLMKLWTPALANAKREVAEMQKLIDAEGGRFELAGWDWWYYAEKVRKATYDFDENQLKPYFSAEQVRDGIFITSNKLFGLSFVPRPDLPVYHPDVKAYEVRDAAGTHLAIYYSDLWVRPGKRPGAWMNSFRDQQKLDGAVTPIVYNVCNFPRPGEGKPSLLSLDDTQTFFHEFGHALHGMNSNVVYPSVSGTATPIDFVEFPSQVMENWSMHPQVLALYAKHHDSGAPLPQALIDKMVKASKFNQGFATVEYLAAAILDLRYHQLADGKVADPQAFERKVKAELGLIPQIAPRYTSTNFSHIFAGGYQAGYYSYVWSEVLDADAFSLFTANGVFDPATAKSFRDNIFAVGGSRDAMASFVAFRGREPKPDALLERRGLEAARSGDAASVAPQGE
jgi:peptidyl-dipeptidase Dcp